MMKSVKQQRLRLLVFSRVLGEFHIREMMTLLTLPCLYHLNAMTYSGLYRM